jgi:hypothetical protein
MASKGGKMSENASFLPWIRERTEVDENKVLFTTSRDVTVRCYPIAAQLFELEQRIRDSISWPARPIRVVEDVAGAKAEVEIAQEYIDSGHADDEEVERWANYVEEQEVAQAEFDDKADMARIRLIAIKGIEVENEDLEAQWLEDWEFIGVEPPEDERERRIHWLQTEILGDADRDIYGIMYGILLASGFNKEVLDEAETLFRTPMGWTGGVDTEGDTETSVEEEES